MLVLWKIDYFKAIFLVIDVYHVSLKVGLVLLNGYNKTLCLSQLT
jgi:hypothetical protein